MSPVYVAFYDMGPRPALALAEQLQQVARYDLCAGVPGVGEGGELRRALAGLDQVARLAQDVARRRGVAAWLS